MNIKTFIHKEVLPVFFVAVPCIGLAMAILGLLFEPDASFGYGVLLSPLIYGFLTSITVLVGYSKRELSFRAALVRKLLQLILIELIVLAFVFMGGLLTSLSITISLVLSVFLVYMTVALVLWVNDKKTAMEFNKALSELKARSESDVNE